jgi:hypothetical protein
MKSYNQSGSYRLNTPYEGGSLLETVALPSRARAMAPQFLFHLEDFPNDVRSLCFEFFYWFSRFEFALKENGYVTKGQAGSAAPAWNKFKEEFAEAYDTTQAAQELFARPPRRQVFAPPNGYAWANTDLTREVTDLGKAVLVVKTIRNNLFHGGKSSQAEWDNPARNIFLLTNAKEVLDSFASLGNNLYADYKRSY